jgi:uncharacterized protein with HEPN domain
MTAHLQKIIPENFTVNLASVWNTVQDDLPLHKHAIKKFFCREL